MPFRMVPGSRSALWFAIRQFPVAGLSLVLSLGSPAHAGVLAVWDFEDTVSASSVAANLSAGDVTISSGSIAFQDGADDGGTRIGNSSTWSTMDFATAGKYIQFSVTPDAGRDVQVTNVTIRLGRTSVGPVSFTAQYSLDGFSTAGTSAGTGTIASEDAGVLDSFTLSVPANAQAGSVTYRVWGHNATSTGNLRFNSFYIYGPVDTVLKPKPSNHAAGFGAVSSTHRTIVLEWTDAASGDLPDGYLVRGSKTGFGDIPDPVDGVNVVNNTGWNGDVYANKITQGSGKDTLTKLAAGQAFYFKLFPYVNQFSTINYKIDGAVPQVMVSTIFAPFEDMEDAEKQSYAASDVGLASGSWNFSEALLGITASDKRHDQRSARIRNLGCITMLFDVTNVETLSLDHADYGVDTGGRFVVEWSLDAGANWQQVADEAVCGETLQTAEFTLHRQQTFRLRIRKTAVSGDESRINIDNIRFTPFEHEPSVFRFR